MRAGARRPAGWSESSAGRDSRRNGWTSIPTSSPAGAPFGTWRRIRPPATPSSGSASDCAASSRPRAPDGIARPAAASLVEPRAEDVQIALSCDRQVYRMGLGRRHLNIADCDREEFMDTLIKDYPGLLGKRDAPCVSLYQPTHRHHPDAEQDPIRFGNLTKEIEERLLRQHPAREVASIMEPFRALADDRNFWNHALDGLAVLAAP